MTTEELTQKFFVYASDALDRQQAERLAASLLELEYVDNIAALMGLARTQEESD